MISLNKSGLLLAGLALIAGCFDTARAQSAPFQAVPSQLVFNIPQPGLFPSQPSLQFSVAATSPGASVQFSTSGPSWLTLTPASGTLSNTALPVTATLSSAAMTLQNGVYNAAISFFQTGTGSGAPALLTVPVTLNVGNQLTVSPSNVINLSYQSGQTPPSVSLNVGSTVSSIPFTITNIMPSSSWLQPSLAPNATTPGTVNININPANLTPGSYTGTFTLSSSAAGVTPVTVTVNLTVSQSATLSAAPQSLNFAFQTGTVSGALPSKTITLSTNGAPVAFTVDPSSQSWLTVAANGTVASQTQAAVLTVTVNPNSPALPPGNYSTNITVRPAGAAANTQPLVIPVNLLVSASPLLIVGNAPNTFTFQIGGATPQDQTISIASSSTVTPVDYTVTDKPAWLDLAPGAGTTSLANSLTLHVNQTALGTLGVGTYTGNVTIRSNTAGNSPVTFPVTLVVAFTPSISTNIGALTFNYQTTSGQLPGGQFFTVNSTGAPLPVGTPTFSSTTCGGNWISVSTANNTTPATVFVTTNTAGITAPSTCTGTISIPSGTSTPLTVPVSLNVSATPLLNVTSAELAFTTPLGSSTVQQKVLTLSSTDPNTPLNYTIATDQPWLSVNPNQGRTDTAGTSTVFINPAVFAQPGTYTGNVTVTNQSANPAGSQPAQKLLVTVTVTSNVTLSTTPASVNIAVPAGGQPVSVPLALNLSSGTAGFTATASSAQGWLKVSTTGGTPGPQVGGSAPATISVIADPASVGLAQGTYNGTITITSPGLQNSPVTVNVTLTVGAPQTITFNVPNISFNTNAGTTGNLTSTFNVTSTGGPVNFIITKAATGCDAISFNPATGTTGASAVPVTVTLNPAGLAMGTVACTLTLSGPQGSGILPQTFIVNVNVGAVLVPQVTAVVNAASFIPGPIAPGEIVTIFGSNIGPTTLTSYILNPNNTFSTTVADTQVLFDTFAAPIIYVRNDQLSVVVPFEIAGRPTVNITIRRGGQTSAVLQIQVANFAPGLFTTNQAGNGQAAIINQNNSTNGPGNPASQGQAVSIYLTGAGLMSLGNQTGGVSGVSPLPALPSNSAVSVTIGGQPASVEYAGGAPGAIAGLYQINARIPANIGSGPQPVSVTVGGVPAQGNVTLFVQ